jgi:hypothetical protein
MMKKIAAMLLVVVMPLALAAQTPSKARGKVSRPTTPIVSPPADVIEIPATLAELAIAQRVYVGRLPCELGAFVSVTADVTALGYFDVETKSHKFRMLPVETSTGAIRLEDRRVGAVWLQLANKSMLMNQKIGQRLADVCMSPEQIVMAEHLIRNPAPSVLDAPIAIAIPTPTPTPSSTATPTPTPTSIPIPSPSVIEEPVNR